MKKDIERLLSPIFLASRVYGVFPFNKKLEFCKGLYLYSLAVAAICSGFRIDYFLSLSLVKRKPLVGITLMTSQGVQILGWITWLRAVTDSKPLVDAINFYKKSHKGELPTLWLSYAFIVIKIARVSVMMVVTNDWQIRFRDIYMSLVNSALRSPLDLAPLQFAAITEITTNIVAKFDEKIDALYISGTTHQAEILTKCHRTCETYKSVNLFYGRLLSLTVLNVFTVLPPFCYVAIQAEVGRRLKTFVITELLLVFFIFHIVVRNCNQLKNQVKKFNMKVNNQARFHEHFMKNEKVSLYLEYDPKLIPKFSTFEIDSPLIIRLTAACMTYMVILLQFENVTLVDPALQSNGTCMEWNSSVTFGNDTEPTSLCK